MSPRSALLLLIGINALFGASSSTAKIAEQELTPFTLGALRFLVASALLLPLLARGWRRQPIPPREWPRLLGLSLLGFGLNNLFYNWGISLSTATDAALLISGEALFTALLSALLLGEVFDARKAVGLVVGAAGAYLLVARGAALDLGAEHVVGDLLILLALVFEALYTILGKTLLARYPPSTLTSAAVAGSLLFWIPTLAWEVARGHGPAWTPGAVGGVLYLGIACTVVGYTGWFWGLRHLDAGRAAGTLFVQPLVGTALGLLVLRETATPATLLGGALVVASMYLVTWPRRAKQATAPPEPPLEIA